MRKFIRLLLYCGLDREEYGALLPAVRAQNQAYLRVFSSIAAGLFLVLTVAGLLTDGFISVNAPVFAACFAASAVILTCDCFFVPRHPKSVGLLIYAFEVLLYLFAVTASLLHKELTAVSAVAFLLVTPLLFYDRPVHLLLTHSLVVLILCFVMRRAKAPSVAEADAWNMVSYGLVGVIEGVFTMQIKMRNLYQRKQIVFLSETDVLTGVKNRNCYESRLKGYPALCKKGLLCVYADVNGLHELNNTQGHEAGDRMLRTVAGEIRNRYGREHTYRIGGDEFVAFGVDLPPENTERDVKEIAARLQKQNYHVSFGTAYAAVPVAELEAVIKQAETEMYRAKSEYYRQPEHSRRKR